MPVHYTAQKGKRTVPEVRSKTASEVRIASVDFQGKLDDGELLTGTVTVTDDTSDLTIANRAVNSAALVINGKTSAIGKAVAFKITGGSAGTTYYLHISVATDATFAQTLNARVKLKVVTD